MSAQLTVACLAPKVKARYLASGKYREGDAGLEKRCTVCGEYWPADSEFFYSNGNHGDGLQADCKACYTDKRYPNGRKHVDA